MAVRVNGEIIDDALIQLEIEGLRPHYDRHVPGGDPRAREEQLQDWARENLIERTLLRQEARKDPEPIPEEAVEETLRRLEEEFGGREELFRCLHVRHRADISLRQEVEDRLRVERLIERITRRVARPKPKAVAEYYRQHRQRFFSPELVRAAQIVKHVEEASGEAAALQAMRSIQEQLRSGEPFEALADRYSDCPGNGGDLGYFPRGQMVPEFEEVVFSLPVGQTSKIFRTCFGYHLARVLDRRPARQQSLQEVREQIEEILYQEKRTQVVEHFIDRLRAEAQVEIVPPVAIHD